MVFFGDEEAFGGVDDDEVFDADEADAAVGIAVNEGIFAVEEVGVAANDVVVLVFGHFLPNGFPGADVGPAEVGFEDAHFGGLDFFHDGVVEGDFVDCGVNGVEGRVEGLAAVGLDDFLEFSEGFGLEVAILVEEVFGLPNIDSGVPEVIA